MQNVDFTKMGVALAEHLKADEGIKTFCNDVFGKDVAILVGDPTDSLLPTANDAPYIFLWGFRKAENITTNKPAEYTVNCGLGVNVLDDSETESGIVISGNFERLGQFERVVQHALYLYKDGCKPPATVEAEIIGALESDNRHWIANITATWQEPQTLGVGEITDF